MKKLTLPKAQRLNDLRDLQQQYRNKGKVLSASFTILYKKNSANYPRLCVVVAKRNVKLAVKRNYIKRTIKESFRVNQALLMNNDIIVIVKHLQPCFDKALLRSEINKQWTRLKTV